MAELNRRFLVSLIAGASLALSAGAACAANLADQMTLGNPAAKVEVVEYASASCPHCARFALGVFPALKKKYIDTGKVHFIFREVLTSPEEVAAAGFMLARCVPPEKYFTTLDGVFLSQPQWQSGDVRTALLNVAEAAGLNEAQFTACISDPVAQKALNDRVEKFTTRDKVDSTPTLFINGKRLVAGINELDFATLDASIAAALRAGPAAPAHKPAARRK
jgi:protein-disulfide isomerase